MGNANLNNARLHGDGPFSAAVIHGGPGAAGEMAPVARVLSENCGILEPLQTAKSIDGQVQELYEVLKTHASVPVTLIGHSWGAWLSFILAARYPSIVKKLVLVGSGPFTEEYTRGMMEKRLGRLSQDGRLRAEWLVKNLEKPDVQNSNEMLSELGMLMSKTDSFAPLSADDKDAVHCDVDIFQSVWKEASLLRQSGELLELGKEVRCPVIAIHGDYDPHPYEGVERPLSQILEDFRFILLKDCGHNPWLERHAKDNFYKILSGEI